MAVVIGAIIGLIISIALGFLITAGLVYLVCLGFGLTFSWILALGVYAALILLRTIFTATVKVNK